MPDILLTHSYFMRFDSKQWRTMQPYAPLATLYAAAVLREAGMSVALFDPMFSSSEEDLASAIRKHKPKIVATYDDSFNYLTKMCLERMRSAAFRMIDISKRAGCQVVVFGSDASDHVKEYLDNGADFLIVGEGEITLREICSGLLAGNAIDLESVKGVAYLSNGMVVRTAPRPAVTDLDSFPFPAWDLVDVGAYRRMWSRHGYFSMNIVTTRGCPFGCNWCAKPIYGRVYNSRSAKNVADEIKWLVKVYHPDHLWFCDDIFGLKPGWIGKFSEEITRRNIKINYKCLSRPDLLLKEDSFDALAASGCRTVWIGAESGDQRVLDAMEKGTTVEQIKEATRRLKERGIQVGYFLQFGYPGEKYDMIKETLALVHDAMPDEIGISVSYPLPGTKFHQRVRNRIGNKRNWYDSDDLALLFPGEFRPDFYVTLHRLTHQRHRLRKILSGGERLTPRSIAALLFNLIRLPYSMAMLRLKRRRNPERFDFLDAFDHGPAE